MVDTLQVAPGLRLPHDAVTQTFAILAMRGRGKTYAASVMVEEMIEAGLPVVVIDPIGVWWGLRSSADGKKPGLPVVIFGGEHADVPLEPTAGRLIADVVIEQGWPCVIDLSAFDSKADEIRFMTDFLTRLYRGNRKPLHVMVDEADEFAPQQAFPEGKRLLGAMEQIVRRGRARGLGCTLISQRPAVLNKNVLSQIETLILLGMTGINDRKAIDEWVGKHADPGQAQEIKASLPGLDIGQAWVWSPSWLRVTKRIKVRKRHTFDSSRTPTVGQKRIEPRARAEVDLQVLGEQILATKEKVDANDPKALHRRIRELEEELRYLKAVPVQIEQVEVPVVSEEQIEELMQTREGLAKIVEIISQAIQVAYSGYRAPPLETPPPRSKPAKPSLPPPGPNPVMGGGDKSLGKAKRAILTVLAQYGPRTKTQLALLSGYSAKGGGFNNPLGALRSAGYISPKGVEPIEITSEGLEALGEYEVLPRGWALVKYHSRNLPKAAKEILNVLAHAYPNGMTKEQIAADTPTRYEPTGGGFNNALGRLRSLELVETINGINSLADVLMEGT